MLLALLPLVVVGSVVALALGVPGGRVLRAAVVVAGVLLVGSVLLLVGVGFVEQREESQAEEEDEAAEALQVRRPDVRIAADDRDEHGFAQPTQPITNLTEGAVRLVEVELDERGLAAQCAAGRRGGHRCAPAVEIAPVEPSAETVHFLFGFARQLDLRGSTVDCGREACELAIIVDGAVHRAVPLRFGDAASAEPQVRVLPRRDVADGGTVDVLLSGHPPGTVTVTLCVPPGPVDPDACGRPAPEVAVEVDASGRAAVELELWTGPVGSADGRCRPGGTCGIAVVGAGVSAPVVPISFAPPAGASPSGTRLALGLVIAAVLTLIGLLVLRRSDWTPTEGDPFAGVDLDDDPFAGVSLDDEPTARSR